MVIPAPRCYSTAGHVPYAAVLCAGSTVRTCVRGAREMWFAATSTCVHYYL